MKKNLIPLVLAAACLLASCNPGSNADNSSAASEPSSVAQSENNSQEDAVKSVAISNKADLTAAWHVGDADRKVELTLDPVTNIQAALTAGTLTIASSDATVISVAGQMVHAVKAGKATITATMGSKSDSVEIEVAALQTAKEKYGTAHAGTEEDPLTNEDAIKVAKAVGNDEKSASPEYYIKGTVESFRDAPSSYGNVSFYFAPATTGGDKFLVYRAVKEGEGDAAKVTDDDIWVTGVATVRAKIYNYNDATPETVSGGILVKCEGTKPAVTTHVVTVAQALTAARDLEDNSSSTDIYVITGFIIAKSGTNFYLSDTKGARTATKDDFEVYNYTGENKDSCTLDAQVKVTTTLKHYVSSKDSTNYAYETGTITSVEILKAGQTEAAPTESTVANAITVINALADGATTSAKYAVTGYIVAITTAYSSKFGNISYTIGNSATDSNTITVYRSTLADGTADTSLVVGAKVKVTGYLQKYVKSGTTTVTPELVSGVTTFLEAPAAPVVATESNVADAVTAATGGSTALYAVTGYIVKVTSAFSSKYNNITFTMSDTLDDENPVFTAYHVTTDAAVAATLLAGAEVKVTGNLTTYNGAAQIAAGGSVELVTATVGGDITLSGGESASVVVDSTVQITATSAGTGTFTYTYASSDATVATVDANGLVTGVAAGTATITVTNNLGRKAYLTVTVTAAGETSYTISSFSAVSGAIGASGYNFLAEKGAATTAPVVKTNAIRVYQNGGTFTISAADGTTNVLTSLTITNDGTSAGAGPFTYVYGTDATAAATMTAGAGAWTSNSFTLTFDKTAGVKYFKLTTTGTDKDHRVYVAGLSIKTAAPAASTAAE